MRRQGKDTKRRIIDAAYELFYKDGFARAGVDAIAERAGVTKRTLYQHFDSKDALVAAVLDIQNELALTRIRAWAERASGDPVTVVDSLFAGFADWSKQRGWRGSGFTRAAMEYAASPGHPARAAAHRHKAEVETWLAQRFAEQDVVASSQLACLSGYYPHPQHVGCCPATGQVVAEAARPTCRVFGWTPDRQTKTIRSAACASAP